MSIKNMIRPENIKSDADHFWNTFDNNETEISAQWIVRFCQNRNQGWAPFTYEEINQFYETNSPHKRFDFNRLLGYWQGKYSPLSLVKDEAGERYIIQDSFVSKICTNPDLIVAN